MVIKECSKDQTPHDIVLAHNSTHKWQKSKHSLAKLEGKRFKINYCNLPQTNLMKGFK